jgi:preprotein translocase subunit SecG
LYSVLLIIHLFLSVVLVVAILLQAGKGGGLAAAFGGGGPSETVFGGRGAATFLTKLTTAVGILFFVTSFSLALLSRHIEGPKSLIDRERQTTTVEPQPYLPGEIPLEESEGQEQPPPAGSKQAGEAGQTGEQAK